jgi:hypothetical protein
LLSLWGFFERPADGEPVYDSTQRMYVEAWQVGRILVCNLESLVEESLVVQQVVRIRRRNEEDAEGL